MDNDEMKRVVESFNKLSKEEQLAKLKDIEDSISNIEVKGVLDPSIKISTGLYAYMVDFIYDNLPEDMKIQGDKEGSVLKAYVISK